MFIELFILFICVTIIIFFVKKSLQFKDELDVYDSWFFEISKRCLVIQKRIEELDRGGAFESDDEVGFFFTSLKELIEYLMFIGIIVPEEEVNVIDKEKEK